MMPKHHEIGRKRKSSHHSDSSDEYEWSELKTDSRKSSEKDSTENATWISGFSSVENFVDAFTKKPNKKQNKVVVTESAQPDELNPYWKNGGLGLPVSSSVQKSLLTKDNEEWLYKSYQRCLERARETQACLRDVLLERWDEQTVDDMLRKFGSDSASRRSVNSKPRWRKESKISVEDNRLDQPKSEEVPKRQLPEVTTETIPDNVTVSEERLVTQDDINTMAAKLLRAEMCSDKNKVQKFKANLEKLRDAHRRGIKIRMHVTHKAMTSTHANYADVSNTLRNFSSAMRQSSEGGSTSASRAAVTSRNSLEEMLHKEQFISSRDIEEEFVSLYQAGRKLNDDLEDVKMPEQKSSERDARRIKHDAVAAFKRRTFAASSCTICVERVPKHLIIHMGQQVFLSLPEHKSLVPGHCILTPFEHVGSITRLDRSCVEELSHLKRSLVTMFAKHLDGSGCVFLENACQLDSPRSHAQIECIPVPMDFLQALPAYFKKALSEVGSEWGQNTRIIKLHANGMGAFSHVPPKLPYFAVEFGVSDGGLARVIDDHRDMPSYFGKEIIGEALELDNHLWRKPKPQKFDRLREKIIQFEQWWSSVSPQGSSACDFPVSTESTEAEGPELPPVL